MARIGVLEEKRISKCLISKAEVLLQDRRYDERTKDLAKGVRF